MRVLLVALPLLVLTACAPKPSAPAANPAVVRATPPPAGFRLPRDARPISYAVTLTVDPAQKEITGTGTIELSRDATGGVLYLSAHELHITSATLVSGAARMPLDATVVDAEMVAFTPSAATAKLPAGRSTLELAWTARVRREDTQGAFAQEMSGATFVYTQFEATAARRVIPCFDEPGFKVPWRLTLRAPAGVTALSNTPVESETTIAGGLRETRFAATPPLPSYLIAFAVGPFEMVDAGKTPSGVPVRVAVPRGHADDAAVPVENTLPVLARLEAYFGTPYPFAKLDFVPIPDTVDFGAMENPGLITFSYDRLLTKPVDRTLWTQRSYVNTAAHELAHQWFGNLVTPAWWDDAWLNESFASWMGDHVIDEWKPEWGFALSNVASKGRLMTTDSRGSSRPVRKEVVDENGIYDAFDPGIVYGKGLVVLDMIENHVGEEAFRDGIRLHLRKHAWGNATYADLLASLQEASGTDVRAIAGDFLDRPGVPFVTFELACEKGHAPRVDMTQRRFVPFGSTVSAKGTWHVPVKVRWVAGGASGNASTVLDAATGSLELTDAKTCPRWIHPNAGAAGYYQWKLAGAPFDALRSPAVFKTLPPEERLEVAQSVSAAVASGDLPYRRSLELAVTLLDDPVRQVRQIGVAAGAGWEKWLPAASRPTYRAWVAKTYAPLAKQLGFLPKPGEPDDDKQIRTQVLGRMSDDARDTATFREATALAWKWLDDRRAVPAESVDMVLAIAAVGGDPKLYERLLAEARKADKSDRERFFGAMWGFEDPALVEKNRALVLGDEFSILETSLFLFDATSTKEGADRAWAFLAAHYDEIAARMPAESRTSLVSIGASCDRTSLERTKAFFAERIQKELQGPQVFARHLESQEQCIARREKDTASFVEFLEARRAAN